jgi:hypothetical protein
VTDGEKMEGSCWTGQSPQWAVVPVEEEEEEQPFIIGLLCVYVCVFACFMQFLHTTRKKVRFSARLYVPKILKNCLIVKLNRKECLLQRVNENARPNLQKAILHNTRNNIS